MPRKTTREMRARRPAPQHQAIALLEQRLRFEWDNWGRARAVYVRPAGRTSQREGVTP